METDLTEVEQFDLIHEDDFRYEADAERSQSGK